jgi:hypothetical protein
MIPVLVALQSVARMLDVAASLPGTKGLMLTLDDFLIGMEQCGRQRIQPLWNARPTPSRNPRDRIQLADQKSAIATATPGSGMPHWGRHYEW